MGHAFTKSCLGGLCGLLLGLAPEARAAQPSSDAGWLLLASLPQQGDLYVSGGFLFSATGRPAGPAVGLGAELSLQYFLPNDDRPLSGVGLFGQWQSINGGEHQRLCAGLQATYVMVGAEFGVTQDFEGRLGAATTSVHVAPFLSVGLLTIGLRVGFPAGFPAAAPSGDKPSYGRDLGLTLALKLPVPVYKNPDNL